VKGKSKVKDKMRTGGAGLPMKPSFGKGEQKAPMRGKRKGKRGM
jgi:hypothetical protein